VPVKRPWWTYAVPYLGRVPNLDRHQWRVLGLLAVAELFDHYDMGILGFGLLHIQQDLGIGEAEVGGIMAAVRLGVLPALMITLLADRLGRRRLLLATIIGFTLCTFATAFSQTAQQFIALQFLARMFIYSETMLAVVVLAEELAASNRGWGIGMLGALGALGYGLAAILFGFVEELPFGWRALYAVGAMPMLCVAWFRRTLPETQRFEEHRATRRETGSWKDWLRPMWHLVRMYPGRIAVLCAALVPLEFTTMTASVFTVKTLQELHGYTPGQVTVLYICGGALAILGNIAAGALSDRVGRRLVLSVLVGMVGLGFYVFYNATGWIVAAAWIVQIFGITGATVLFKALGSELFPTSYRSTASGVRTIVGTLGGIAGLALEGTLYQITGSHAAAITLMIPALAVTPIVIFAFLPETATRELEDISPER
jgi:MFS family permease